MRLVLLGLTTQHTHGVPVVMNMLASGLRGRGHDVSLLTNGYRDAALSLHDRHGVTRFANREQLLVALRAGDAMPFDVAHVHSAHFADAYRAPDGSHDPTPVAALLHALAPRAVVFTDHHNPSETRRLLRELHGVDVLALSDSERNRFLTAVATQPWPSEAWFQGFHAAMLLGRRQLMALANAIVHVSAYQRDAENELLPNYQMDARHRVIWNGTDLHHHASDPWVTRRARFLRAEWLGNTRARALLYTGRAAEEKGIFDLARAASLLAARGQAVALVYAGEFNESVRREIEQRTTTRCIFAGLVEDRRELAAMFRAADLAVQPTWGECFNLSVAEALAVGVPSVVTDSHGTAEVYVRNGWALGCRAQHPESLSRAIERGLTDDALRSDIVHKASSARETLSDERMVEQHVALYREVRNAVPTQ